MSDILLQSESNLSRVEKVYRELKNNIVTNEYPAGYQALEPEIAKQLAVSRTPVREALIRLESEQLIELIPRRGMRVLPLSPGDLIEINEVLGGLELAAIERISRLAPSADRLQSLADILVLLERALADDDLPAWAKADEQFRSQLVELSGNKRLAFLAGRVRSQIARATVATLSLRPKPTAVNEAYKYTYTALADGEWQRARSIYSAHIATLSDLFLNLISQYNFSYL